MSAAAPRGAVTVIGSAHMDLVATAARVPASGETLLGDAFAPHPGGKAANQAAAAALQGVPVYLVARLGRDAMGDGLQAALRAKGVDLTFVGVDPEASTGVSLVLTGADGEYASIIVPGASGRLDAADLAVAAPALARSAVVMTQLELGVDLAHRALAAGKRAGLLTMLTAAPAPSAPLPDALWRVVDVLLVNRHEAAVLLGDDNVATEQAEAAVVHLATRLGVAAIVVTLGADGAVAWDAGQVGRLPARAVPVVDTLGAGDALAGVLARGLARGQTLFTALPAAIAAGSLATTRAGAFDALPTAAAVAALLQRRGD